MQALNIVMQKPMDQVSQSRLKALLASTTKVLYVWNARTKGRRAMAKLDESLLRDLGINATERDRECAKPFWKA